MPMLRIERDNRGVATLTLDREEARNALSAELVTRLAEALAALAGDRAVRIVKLTGAGTVFCAGADIRAWADIPPAEFARLWVRGGHRIFHRLARLPMPTIAVIQAHAFGGGLELAATCDIRVMAASATIALPETQVGIVPGWSGTQRLARLIPEPLLKEMALFGRRISAERALAAGFVAEVAEEPLAAAQAIAGRLLETSPRATEVAKYMIHAAVGEDRDAMIEALGSGMIAASADKAEGVAAFAAKRKPVFPGT